MTDRYDPDGGDWQRAAVVPNDFEYRALPPRVARLFDEIDRRGGPRAFLRGRAAAPSLDYWRRRARRMTDETAVIRRDLERIFER